MSSFVCEKCGELIVDTPDGYITGCKHYPLSEKNILSPNMKGRINHEQLREIAEKVFNEYLNELYKEGYNQCLKDFKISSQQLQELEAQNNQLKLKKEWPCYPGYGGDDGCGCDTAVGDKCDCGCHSPSKNCR